MSIRKLLAVVFFLAFTGVVQGAESNLQSRNDEELARYFQAETQKLSSRCLTDIETLDGWKAKRPVYKKQLLEMLGLDPFPEKTPLHATVTGTVDHAEFTVENLHFQSKPHLYVTANLYIPKGLDKPAPTILYVCGHGPTKKNGVSYGNKVTYQHHGGWFARNGYVCLIIDTVHLGEIEGIHHGTYRYNMWWWNCRGYTSAAVEAWNCVRALDYLETRSEVDASRIGVTGRSGGGAYSWWIAAIDERIKAAVPVAGITDLQNHVVDGCVEGHCDCMYLCNTYRWDYPMVAAMVAPRPLLISNTDKDGIFPLDGVVRLHKKVRDIYKLYDAEKNLGLHITEGPHKDTQELRVHAFVWFNRFLKGENTPITTQAVKFFEPEQLKVFDELPADQINTKIQETFVPLAPKPEVPTSPEQWIKMRDAWMQALTEKVFRGWPDENEAGPPMLNGIVLPAGDGMRWTVFAFKNQKHVPVRLSTIHRDDLAEASRVILHIQDQSGIDSPRPSTSVGRNEVHAYFLPRSAGWVGDERTQTHVRRRFNLLGQTADGMRVWDVRQAIELLASLGFAEGASIDVTAQGDMAGVALHAALFEPSVKSLELYDLPSSHRDGPVFLNVLRYLDVPQVVAMAAERMKVTIHTSDESAWDYPMEVAESLGWDPEQFCIERTQ